MNNKGFIKLSRKFFENPLWKEPRAYTRAEAWIDLISIARFEASIEICNNRAIEVQKGEIMASRRFLETRWGWGSTKVVNFLKYLELSKMVTSRQTSGLTILKLCNFDVYNDGGSPPQTKDKPPTNQRQTTDKPNIKKEKKDKKEKNIITGSASAAPQNSNASCLTNNAPTGDDAVGEEKEKSCAKKEKVDFRAKLVSIGVSPQTADDWLAVRRAKRATNTHTALEALLKQLRIAYAAGVTPEECIKTATENDWRGFQFIWLQNLNTRNDGTRRKTSARKTESELTDEELYRACAEGYSRGAYQCSDSGTEQDSKA